jgi:hypothetical protein
MSDTKPFGDGAGITDILSCAARTLATYSNAMIIELQRHANRLGPARSGQRGNHRTVHAARHGNDDTSALQRVATGRFKLELRVHRAAHSSKRRTSQKVVAEG